MVVLTTLVGGIPRVVQGALAVALGLWAALIATDGGAALAQLSIGALAAIAAHEAALGAALGSSAALPLLAAAAAGAVVDHAQRARRGPYAPLFGVLAAAVFVGIDGHVAAIAAVVDSYAAAPATGDRAGVLATLGALVPIAVAPRGAVAGHRGGRRDRRGGRRARRRSRRGPRAARRRRPGRARDDDGRAGRDVRGRGRRAGPRLRRGHGRRGVTGAPPR